MEKFINGLAEFAGIAPENFEAAIPFFTKVNVPAGKLLLSAGDIASNLWFVDVGILRAYYLEQDLTLIKVLEQNAQPAEITTWIIPAFGFLTDISSFLYQKPGHYYIETLEPSTLYQLSYQNYKALSELYPEMGHLTHESTFELMDMRVRMCGLRSAADRLAFFEKQYPGITGRISVNIQASYLNITPSTLSRIRNQRK
ncbi:CRP-like cAMP-binding protein [Dyadobacter jejuensis]|uniref:CRP-like cAMP-binding protein n=1 Tax=Dyadobacter jejuensis TaxID=1082580 RepID=A0A316AIS2_9BACT|nr:Crp/Fnr family transcriptional regulator [Dyadobacter jejuensis]PWJ57695.1 CRP-like cAMP-binding protein [Dyadobacter jejuensis]